MGMGRASGGGEDRAKKAALEAIDSPLLELSIDGARGVLFNVQGGKNLSMYEINEAATIINQHVDPEAKIIFGTSIDPNLQDEIRITVIATGFTKDARDDLPTTNSFGNTLNGSESRSNGLSYTTPKFGGSSSSPSTLTSSSSSTTTKKTDFDDDQLDIPAFLRKKMEE
jgi:cell division protein FtsZ